MADSWKEENHEGMWKIWNPHCFRSNNCGDNRCVANDDTNVLKWLACLQLESVLLQLLQ